MMKKALPSLLIAAASLPCLQAQIIQTRTFGPQIPQFSTVMTFDSYEGNLEDIESIEIKWQMDIADGFLVVDNDSPDPATGNYEFGASISVDGADVTMLNNSFSSIFTATEVINSGSFSLAGNQDDGSNDYSPDGPDGTSIEGNDVAGDGGDVVNSLFYDQYVFGTGGSAGKTFDIGITTEQYLNVSSDGGTEYAITPVNASGIVKVIYNLKPVPEPSSAAMLALGSLVLLRRRR